MFSYPSLQLNNANNGTYNNEHAAAKGHNGCPYAFFPGIGRIAEILTAKKDQTPGQKMEIGVDHVKDLQNRQYTKYNGYASKKDSKDTKYSFIKPEPLP